MLSGDRPLITIDRYSRWLYARCRLEKCLANQMVPNSSEVKVNERVTKLSGDILELSSAETSTSLPVIGDLGKRVKLLKKTISKRSLSVFEAGRSAAHPAELPVRRRL